MDGEDKTRAREQLTRIRIPRTFIEEASLGGELDMTVEGGALVLRRATVSRAGWDAAFAEMARLGDDAPLNLDVDLDPQFTGEEWTWD